MAYLPQRRESFWVKLDRAEKHLLDLQEAMAPYLMTDPYDVRTGIEGRNKRRVHRLSLESPMGFGMQEQISVITADLIHNLLSCLNQLAYLLHAPRDRKGIYFPIYFKGVWEPAMEEENEQKVKERGRWKGDVRGLHPDAVAILKALQPPDDSTHLGKFYPLRVVRTLANIDRHKRFPITTVGLRDPQVSWTDKDGVRHVDPRLWGFMLKQEAPIKLEQGATNVDVHGTPALIILIADKDKGSPVPTGISIPEALMESIESIRRDVVQPLAPYVWTPS